MPPDADRQDRKRTVARVAFALRQAPRGSDGSAWALGVAALHGTLRQLASGITNDDHTPPVTGPVNRGPYLAPQPPVVP
eukprot:6363401-Prorocentrum_lima.AAC.1